MLIMLYGTNILSSSVINVLGVLLDYKLHLSKHVPKSITKANEVLNAIKILRRIFKRMEV
jgi:hypothetical protein